MNDRITQENASQWAEQLADATPEAILKVALEQFSSNLAVSFSGAEDVVLIDMATKVAKQIDTKPIVRVFTLDTGRLHAETYEFLEKVREHYSIDLELCFPDTQAVQNLVQEKGLFSFYKDDHAECCAIRKVGPLRKKLATLDSWVTGQRKDQSPGTRAAIPVVQYDSAFSSPDKPLIKFNPLVNWSSAQVWNYIRTHEVPYNALHEKGFVSIGCQPCTRAVLPNQHEREGRWWWEEATKKECGLHAMNAEK